MSKPKKEKFCKFCGKLVSVSTGKYCSDECRTEGKKRALTAKKELSLQKRRKSSKKFLSINEVLSLGRKHGIHEYGRIVAAIEKGEI